MEAKDGLLFDINFISPNINIEMKYVDFEGCNHPLKKSGDDPVMDDSVSQYKHNLF